MLIGLTVCEPSETPVCGSRAGVEVGKPYGGLAAFSGGMPILFAVSMIFCGPSSIASVMSM